MNARSKLLLQCALLVLLIWVAYLPALRGGFIWDDDAYVTANPLLTEPDGLRRIWLSTHSQSQYFPLTYTTLRCERALWGLNPLGYHAINLALHSLNALLAWSVLRRLALPGAWLAATVFALHPVQVESVAWVTEVKNLQSSFFYLLALLAWMKFTESSSPCRAAVPHVAPKLDEGGSKSSSPWVFYVLALLLHTLALFSKTTACTLPAAMLLTLWLRQEPVGRRRLLQVAPFLALGLAMGLVSVWWEGHLGIHQRQFGLTFSPVERLLIATRAVWFYAWKLVWPLNLAFSYPRWEINAHDPSQYLWGLACVAAAFFLWRNRRTLGRGPIAAMVFFVAALSPMLGFFPLYTFYYSFVADHYQYLACLGPIALFAGVLSQLCAKWRLRDASPRSLAGVVASGALLLVFGLLTWRQTGAYHDLETLWRDTLKKNPSSWMAHSNLGMVLASQGERAQAEEHYRAALRLKPGNAEVHYNLGNLLVATGRTGEAIGHYEQALESNPNDPDLHNNLGVALYTSHQTEQAILHLRQALRLKPGSADTHYNLGIALAAAHQFEQARQQYLEALRLKPDSAEIKARLRALGAQ